RMDIPRSSYYRWRARYRKHGLSGLKDQKPVPKGQWNALAPSGEEKILEVAEEIPELSAREISYHITDNEDFTVSESSVYRILKREGLIRETKVQSFSASKEYHSKP